MSGRACRLDACMWFIGSRLSVCVSKGISVNGCGSKQGFVAVRPPLFQTFVVGALLQTLVAVLCVEYCSLQQACRRAGFSQHPNSVASLVAKRPPGPVTSPIFLSRCHMSIHKREGGRGREREGERVHNHAPANMSTYTPSR